MALKPPNLKREIKPTAKELGKSDQVALTCGEQSSGRVKSYRCTFCRRCFSNSQALGGHMNIHRKDRAKLKELSADNLLSLGIARKDPSDYQSPAIANDELFQLQSKEEKSCPKKRPYHLTEELSSNIPKEGADDLLQLSLFADTTSTRSYEEVSNCTGKQVGENVPLGTRGSHTQLDLELRLGPEPHETFSKGVDVIHSNV